MARLDIDYKVGEWSGKPKLQCAYCAWNTMAGETRMDDHLDKVHRDKLPPLPPPPCRPIKAVLVDPDGKQITHIDNPSQPQPQTQPQTHPQPQIVKEN